MQQQVPSSPEESTPTPSSLDIHPLSSRVALSEECSILYRYLKEKLEKLKGAHYNLPGVTRRCTTEANNQLVASSSRQVELTLLVATSGNSTTHSLSSQGTPHQGHESSSSSLEGAEQVNSARQDAINTVPGDQGLFWRQTLPRIATICGALGFLLTVTFGVAGWLAQDRSIAIARESELVSLALSCSDEKTKQISICQQYLEKYPNGPAISRRGNSMEAEKAFIQNIISWVITSTYQQADDANSGPMTTIFFFSSLVIISSVSFVFGVILLLYPNIAPFISRVLCICTICWIWLRFEILKNWIAYLTLWLDLFIIVIVSGTLTIFRIFLFLGKLLFWGVLFRVGISVFQNAANVFIP